MNFNSKTYKETMLIEDNYERDINLLANYNWFALCDIYEGTEDEDVVEWFKANRAFYHEGSIEYWEYVLNEDEELDEEERKAIEFHLSKLKEIGKKECSVVVRVPITLEFHGLDSKPTREDVLDSGYWMKFKEDLTYFEPSAYVDEDELEVLEVEEE